ncbi:hypothetical protein FHX42_001231 [Saccharopolyspora lacisalsi]|uniref:Uncharacterized protein n=1 Tax=Halosaccharopolyspora lacisalsi TaxID=1000566 RepID=A0A839DPH8_9PSEU|nr:hypothetical protein [Halosaccharopolyspora lacisalsi]MBA8823902.1 hypothetical protein [Halosaccharopolyspora lacisalsi]
MQESRIRLDDTDSRCYQTSTVTSIDSLSAVCRADVPHGPWKLRTGRMSADPAEHDNQGAEIVPFAPPPGRGG